MPKKQIKKTLDIKSIEKLLNEQTLAILSAVDERLIKSEVRIDKKLIEMEIRLNAKMDKKIFEMEERINQKFDKLTTTLDKFLKRVSDTEDEIEIMKLDIIRLKKVIKEKVGVDLS